MLTGSIPIFLCRYITASNCDRNAHFRTLEILDEPRRAQLASAICGASRHVASLGEGLHVLTGRSESYTKLAH
jgi:hypothetical protein